MRKDKNKQRVAGLLDSAMVGFDKKTSIISGANSVSNQATKEYLAHIWRQYKNASSWSLTEVEHFAPGARRFWSHSTLRSLFELELKSLYFRHHCNLE